MIYTGRHIVLVEDDATMGNSLVQRLELEGANVTWVRQKVLGVAAVRTPHRPVDAVVCDIRLPDGTGEDIFEAVSQTSVPPPFIFITGQGDIDQAVRLLRAGAADYLTKPLEMPALLERLAMAFSSETGEDGFPAFNGISPVARQLDAQIAEIAETDRHVLIKGQRGLGKARIARRIHDQSDRRAAKLVTLNGYEQVDLQSQLSIVGEGTLVVSAIEKLPDRDQCFLIDALRAGEFRLIASAAPEIETLVKEGRFREDLYFALVACEIVVSPLSQRPEDAVWLSNQFFDLFNARRPNPLKGLSELSIATLREHDWPGNGREVRARVVRSFSTVKEGWIFPSDLFPELSEQSDKIETLAATRDSAERRQILRALDQTGGQMAESARLLGVSRTTLWEKMQKHGL